MKTMQILIISLALWVWYLTPVYSSSQEPVVEWDPDAAWEWVIVVKPGPVPFQVFQVSDHFRWEWGIGRWYPEERIGEAEHLAWRAVGERPVETPEPATWLLLASGLMWMIRRRVHRESRRSYG